jgi:hypothetical protein
MPPEATFQMTVQRREHLIATYDQLRDLALVYESDDDEARPSAAT